MTNKHNKFDLTNEEMQKLWDEIRFYDDIEPISLEELKAIGADYQAIPFSAEVEKRLAQQFEDFRQEFLKD